MAKLEVRYVQLRTDSAQNAPMRLVGRAVSYNSLSKPMPSQSGFIFRERFLPGSLSRSLASGDDVICTFQHDEGRLLGRTSSGTLKLSDSPEGLDFAVLLDKNQQAHRDLYSAVQRGDVHQCSFGFATDDDQWTDDDPSVKDENGQRCALRTVRSAKLYSVDCVVSPAYEATAVAARSSLGRKILSTLFPKKKSLEQTFVDANGFDPWLAQARKIRQDMEIRVGAERLARAQRNVAVDGPGYGPTRDSSGGGQVADPTQSLRCPADSTTSSKDEHARAVDFHRNIANHSQSREEYELQTGLADAHKSVLDWDYDDDDTYDERVCRCIAGCSAWASKHGSYVAGMHGANS